MFNSNRITVWMTWILMGIIGMGTLSAQEAKPVKPAKKIQIELVFVLDTTGSMSGLIQGAKAKIWSIVNTVASAKPTPEIKVALVAYRDRTDAYITQITDLSYDLDAVYAKLMEFKAQGGGDFSEDVNSALVHAVDKISWSADKSVIKMIYLVGDAPPHMDYNEETYVKTCPRAVKKWITINTVRCGGNAATEQHWQKICALADGKYTSVAQDGGMAVVATPMDKELSTLNSKLNSTFLGYGRDARDKKKRMVEAERTLEAGMAESMDDATSGSARAERISYKAKTIDSSFSRAGDLVSEYKKDSKVLKNLKKEQLPEEMQKMNAEQRAKYLAEKSQERDEIKKKILELDKQRQQYIKKELSKLNKGKGNAFDSFVLQTLIEVAKKRGIELSDK